jgi:hypothetical protein
MADVKTDKEPSIEEILESIRQIISEDGDAAPKEIEAAAPPLPPVSPAPKMEEALELTEKVEPMDSDLDLSEITPPADEDNNVLLSDTTAEAATAAMAKLLAGNVAVERNVPGRVGSLTLEDMARDLMRPLIKSWLDQNLSSVIEKMVQKEIDKISKRAGA